VWPSRWSRPARWRLSTVARDRQGSADRVAATVDGRRVAFESGDGRLEPSAEAFAGPFLLPAVTKGARLVVDSPLDAAWVLSTSTLAGLYARRWGYAAAYPVEPVSTRHEAVAPAPGHGLYFDAGVEAFHALFSASSRYDTLVLGRGLEDARVVEAADAPREEALRAVARETGKRAVVVRTDLRGHPHLAAVPWERARGGARAAIGHLLANRLGELTIPAARSSSVPARPADPRSDELFSSHRVRVHRADAPAGAPARLHAIARYPLAQHHLKVCLAPADGGHNCSRCAPCVWAMAALDAAGLLDRFAAFAPSRPLADLVRDLPPLEAGRRPPWEDLLDLSLDATLRRVVEDLLARSRSPSWVRWLARG